MSTWTAEEIFEGLQRWLKFKRDEFSPHSMAWVTTDNLLDEVRENGYEGFFPWQRISKED